jgi:hypothetical protein
MIRALLLIFLALQYTIPQHTGALATAPSAPTASWSFLQSTPGGCGAGPTCTFSITATTANSVVVVPVYTATNLTITSATLAGCATPGTFTGGSGSSYQAFGSPPGGLAWGYILGNGGGCTDLSVTMSAADSGNISPSVEEFSRGGGTPVLDTLASTNTNTTSCTSCTGSSFPSLSGTKDLMVQIANTGSGTGNPSSPYAWDHNDITAYVLNSTATAAPTWTQSSGGFETFGVAFK